MWELDPNKVEVVVGEAVIGKWKWQEQHILSTERGMFMVIRKALPGQAMCGNCGSKDVKAMIVGGGGSLYVVAHCGICNKMMMHVLESNDEDLPEDVRIIKHMEFGVMPGPSDN